MVSAWTDGFCVIDIFVWKLNALCLLQAYSYLRIRNKEFPWGTSNLTSLMGQPELGLILLFDHFGDFTVFAHWKPSLYFSCSAMWCYVKDTVDCKNTMKELHRRVIVCRAKWIIWVWWLKSSVILPMSATNSPNQVQQRHVSQIFGSRKSVWPFAKREVFERQHLPGGIHIVSSNGLVHSTLESLRNKWVLGLPMYCEWASVQGNAGHQSVLHCF